VIEYVAFIFLVSSHVSQLASDFFDKWYIVWVDCLWWVGECRGIS